MSLGLFCIYDPLNHPSFPSRYEILGSYKSRKRYDQGMIHKSHSQDFSSPSEPAEEDDAQTRFYKQHMKRDKAPPPTGATPIYNFDEWAKAHYGINFERRQNSKRRYDRLKTQQGNTQVRHIEISVLLCLAFVCIMTAFSKFDQSSYDQVKEEAPKKVDS